MKRTLMIMNILTILTLVGTVQADALSIYEIQQTSLKTSRMDLWTPSIY